MEAIHRRGFRVLPLDEGLRRLADGSLPPKSLSITFDDGEVGFYTHAHPILAEYGFPATVYLTTYYVENRLPVITVALSYVLWAARGNEATVDLPALGRVQLDTSSPEAREATWSTLMARMERERLNGDARDDILRRVARALELDYGRFREERRLELMNPSEVRELASQGVDFQLHTHRHRVPEDRGRFLKEIRDNREAIRRYAGTSPEHFCYPSGQYNEQVVAWLREEGIRSATTCDPGLATSETDPLLLPRLVDVPTLAPVEFEAWLDGIAAWLPRRSRR